jgi:cation diffusion facilitator CzcD-associated flavoprotein CzcO
MRSVETVVVGAGQAGLVVSILLSQAGREHVVLVRGATPGGAWQDRPAPGQLSDSRGSVAAMASTAVSESKPLRASSA